MSQSTRHRLYYLTPDRVRAGRATEVTLRRLQLKAPPAVDRTGVAGGPEEQPRSGRADVDVKKLFGPELLLTQGDIAEGVVFNVTWTGSSISREDVLPSRNNP